MTPDPGRSVEADLQVGLQHRNFAYLAWIAVCVLWGTTYLAIRIALETIPPGLVGGLRYACAGLLLALLLALRGERLPARSQWPGLALVGLLTIVVGNGGVIWAEQWVPSGIAAVTVATVPFWMTGIEALAPDGHRLSWWLVAGLLVGFGGIVLLVWPEILARGAAGHQFLVGVVALQAACAGWSLGSAVSRRHAREENVLAAAAVQMVFGGLFMLLAGTLHGEWSHLAFTPRTLAAEIYLTLVGSIVGYSAYLYALKYLPTATVSLYAYANPIIAIILGAVLLGEPFGPRVVVASLMVLAGSALVQKRGASMGTARRAASTAIVIFCVATPLHAQQPQTTSTSAHVSAAEVAQLLAGAALGLGLHESGHLVFDAAFGASPGVRKVSAGFIPFFAVTHHPVSPAREFTISSAGFWVQHGTSEILLTRRPDLRHEHAPVAKGLLAFNVLTSVMYAGAAFARHGPLERDTRGMAISAEVGEPWIGVSILAPAALDAARYYRPRARWLRWGSRASKVGGAMLILKAVR